MPTNNKPLITLDDLDRLESDTKIADAQRNASTGEKIRRAFGVAGMNIANIPGALAQISALGLVATPFAELKDLNDLNTTTGKLNAFGESSLQRAGELFNVDPESISAGEDIAGAIIAAPIFIAGALSKAGALSRVAPKTISKLIAAEGATDAGLTEFFRGLTNLDTLTPLGTAGEHTRDELFKIFSNDNPVKIEMPSDPNNFKVVQGGLGIKDDSIDPQSLETIDPQSLEKLAGTIDPRQLEIDDAEAGLRELEQIQGSDPYSESVYEKVNRAILIALAAAGGAQLISGAIRRFGKSQLRDKNVDFGENPSTEFTSQTSAKETFLINNIDPNEGVASQIGRALGEDEGTDFLAQAAQSTRLGAATRAQFALDTGQLPDSNIRINSVRELQDEFAGLSEAEQTIFREGIFAADELDQRLLARSQGKAGEVSTTNVSAPTHSDTDLVNKMNAITNNPRLASLRAKYYENNKNILRYWRQQGILSDEGFRQLAKDHPHFMPRVANPFSEIDQKYKGRPIVGGIHRRIFGWRQAFQQAFGNDSLEVKILSDMDHLRKRNISENSGLSDVVDPLAAHEYYVAGATLLAQKNKVKLRAIESIMGDPVLGKGVREVRPPGTAALRSKLPAARNNEAVVRVLKDGKSRFFEFADPMLAKAVDFVPHSSPGILGMSRRIFQFGTTGPATLFAFKSIVWDSVVAGLLRKPGYQMGLIDGFLQRNGFKFGLPGDPTVYISAVLGVSKDVAAKINHQIVSWISSELANSSSVLKPFEKQLRPVADALWRQYLKSTRALMMQTGAYNTGFLVDVGSTYNGLLKKFSKAYNSGNLTLPEAVTSSLVNVYMGFIESLHQGVKVAFFAQNYRPNMGPRELRKLALETRNLTGDFSKSGIGKLYRDVTETVPYSNVTIQATRRMADSAKASFKADGGMTFTVGLMATAVPYLGAALVASAYLNDEYRDYFWNKMAPFDRISNVTLFIPGLPPEDAIKIPLPPEVQVPLSLMLVAVDNIFGLSDGRIARDEFADIKEALAQYLGIILPPFLSAPLAAAGYKADSANVITDEDVLRPQKTSRVGGFDSDTNRIPGSWITSRTEEVLNSLFGTIAKIFVEMYQTSEQALALGQSPGQAIDAVSDNLGQQIRRRLPGGAGVWGGHNPVSIATAANKELSRKIDALNNITKQIQVELNNAPGAKTRPVDAPEALLPPKAINPKFKESLSILYTMYQGNSALRELLSQRNAVKRNLDAIDANLTIDPKLRIAAHNREAKKYIDLSERLLYEIRRFESFMGTPVEELDPFVIKN